jgi:superfamily II DNA or RNA helicase
MTGPYLQPQLHAARSDAWADEEFYWISEDLPIKEDLTEDVETFLLKLTFYNENKSLYKWQEECLRLLWCRRLKYSIYLLDCATGAGKSIVAYGTIFAYTYNLSYPYHKALLAVPYRNLAVEKWNELHKLFSEIMSPNFLPADYIKLIEGPGANRQLNYSRVAVCTYEHCLAILSSAMTVVEGGTNRRLRSLIRIIVVDEAHMLWDNSRGKVVNQIIALVDK